METFQTISYMGDDPLMTDMVNGLQFNYDFNAIPGSHQEGSGRNR